MATKSRIFIIAISLLLAGCGFTHHYTPRPTTYDFPPIPEFESSNDVTLVNTQDSIAPVFFGNAGIGHEWYGNLKEWTDVAISIANREISNRGVNIHEGSAKRLELSIVSIKSTTGGWGFRCYVDLKVTTSDGYERVFQGQGPSALINKAADAGVMYAVAEMLKDRKIVEFLTN